jgi:hypothetical protein
MCMNVLFVRRFDTFAARAGLDCRGGETQSPTAVSFTLNLM